LGVVRGHPTYRLSKLLNPSERCRIQFRSPDFRGLPSIWVSQPLGKASASENGEVQENSRYRRFFPRRKTLGSVAETFSPPEKVAASKRRLFPRGKNLRFRCRHTFRFGKKSPRAGGELFPPGKTRRHRTESFSPPEKPSATWRRLFPERKNMTTRGNTDRMEQEKDRSSARY
jgi:hypothetical protein